VRYIQWRKVLSNQLKEYFMAYQNTQEIIWIERVFKVMILGIFIWSIWALYKYAPSYYEEQKHIEFRLAETYGFSQEIAETVQCYKGYLHYPNIGVFSGLLAVTPSISCDTDTLKQQKENRHLLRNESLGIEQVSLVLFFCL
jgi:hypothetical protein